MSEHLNYVFWPFFQFISYQLYFSPQKETLKEETQVQPEVKEKISKSAEKDQHADERYVTICEKREV